MSKTDKTRPAWIILTDPPKGVQLHERHYCHGRRDCDLGVFEPVTRRTSFRYCAIWGSYKDNDKVYGRVPKRSARKALGFEGRNRMLLRQLRKSWMNTDLEDIDSRQWCPVRRAYVYNRWRWD